MVYKKSYKIGSHTISINVPIDDVDSSKVLSNKYSYIDIEGRRLKMVSKSDKTEFFDRILTQINYLNTRQLDGFSLGPFFDALITGCIAHIEKYDRIINTDLWSEVDCTMWIVDACKGIFHNSLSTLEECISYRKFLIDNSMKVLFYKLWLPHPDGETDVNGMVKIVKASDYYTEP